MNRWTVALFLSTSVLAPACAVDATDPGPAADAAPERGLGKADGAFGSCLDGGEPTCGGPAAEGNCWCDDLCTDFGDCCADKAEVCGGEDPSPTPQLCLADADCGQGQVCDHSECLSGCSGDTVCPAVCFGACVDETPEPDCQAPDGYFSVDPAELFDAPDAFVGQAIALGGTAQVGFPFCTLLACSPEAPCCNACGAGLQMSTGAGDLEMSGLGCGGNECTVMDNCDYDPGTSFVAWGTLQSSFGFLHLEVDGHCSAAPEPGPTCDCEDDQQCVEVCPGCIEGTPPEQCTCSFVCLDFH